MRKLLIAALALGLLVFSGAPVSAQISIPFVFVNSTPANADEVNAVNAALGAQALNRTGGTMTGPLTARAILTTHNTYDIGTTAARFKDGYFAGTVYATTFSMASLALSSTLGVRGTADSTVGIYLQGTSAGDSTLLIGIESNQAVPSGTTNAYGIYSSVKTVAAAWTLGNASAIVAASPFLGAGSSITTAYGVFINKQKNAGVTTGYGVYVADAADLNYFAGAISSPTSAELTGTTNNLGTITFGVWNAQAVSAAGLIQSTGAAGGFNLTSRDGTGTAFVVYNPTGDDWNIFNGGSDIFKLTTAGVLTLPAYTAATWVAGDRYLVVNAAGVVHLSAVGPGS